MLEQFRKVVEEEFSGLPLNDDEFRVAEKIWIRALQWMFGNADGSCGVRRCIPMESLRMELGIEPYDKQEKQDDFDPLY